MKSSTPRLTRPSTWLTLAILLYIALFSWLSWLKLDSLLYDNLDLAIFNSTLFNLSHGYGLYNAIHPPSFFGDHFSPFLYVLAPVYRIWSAPLFLLLLQSLVLGLCSWPLYRIASRYVSSKTAGVIALLWLLNPLIHNANLFEFHLLPFAVFALLWSFYYYQKNAFLAFLVCGLIALSTREDISLIFATYGILAVIDKKSWPWRLIPLLLGGMWFITAQTVIVNHSAIAQYKFSAYYEWLTQAGPAEIIRHIFSYPNLEFILGLFFPLLFIPLVKPKYLLLLIAPLASFMFSRQGGGSLLLETHYALFFIWPLFVTLASALSKLARSHYVASLPYRYEIGILVLIVTAIYSAVTYGAIVPTLRSHHTNSLLLKDIPTDAVVAASYSPLSNMSSRYHIQSLAYAYASKGQFLRTEYQLDPETDFLVIDWQDMIKTSAHYQIRYNDVYDDTLMDETLQKILADFQPVQIDGPLMLLTRNTTAESLANLKSAPEISTVGVLTLAPATNENLKTNYALSFTLPAMSGKNYIVEVDDDETTYTLPLGYGIYDTRRLLENSTISMPLSLRKGERTINIRLYSWSDGYLYLNDTRSLGINFQDKELVAEISL